MDDVSRWPHLQDLAHEMCLPDIDLADEVHLLIGLDQPDVLAPRDVRRGKPGEPYAILTGLEWTLNGPVAAGQIAFSTNYIRTDATLQQTVERFWKLDDLGQINNGSLSVIDKQVIDLWSQGAVKEAGHYTLPIPFKKRPPPLPRNYVMAKHRLDLLGKRLRRDPNLMQEYVTGIHDALRQGYAEEVTDVQRQDEYVWYLPHHPVQHPRKPGKVRIVFDCSARFQGMSLNDCIKQGPDLTNRLLGVLLKFRQEPIAINANIEGMFNQVKVPVDDRDVLRFLWWEDDDPAKPPKHYRMTTHLFGGVWSPSAAAYTLQCVAEDNQQDFTDYAIQTVKQNFYMDDCLKFVPTEDAAIALAMELCDLLARGGFRLTKWLSNSKKVTKSIRADQRAKSLHELNLDVDDLPCERTLGVLWDVEKDRFTFDVKVSDKPTTKRGILSVTSSVYDPLGFAGPFVLRGKAIFQELCRRKFDWDEKVSADIAQQWHHWLADLPALSKLTIPRCLRPADEVASAELHHFSDASELAYGAVSYIRFGNQCTIVMAQNRLAPIKATSIPRLELMATVVATELDQHIKTHIQITINKTFFWTESIIVLQYLRNEDRRFQTFVANRVAKILNHTEPSQWNYVDSASNPADDVSRGMTADEILSSEWWISEPTFLRQPEDNWPMQPVLANLPEDAEVKRPKDVYSTNSSTDSAASDAIERLLQRYSDWHTLKRAVVMLLRFKSLLRKKATTQLKNSITVDELQKAEVVILGHVQTTLFGSAVTRSNPAAKLKPFVDDVTGLILVGGRLTNAPIPFEAKHPIILPGSHHITRLIVKYYHTRLGHAGQERVLAEIRQRFWILKGHAAVGHILKACLKCRKQKARPQAQQMANLPESRVHAGDPPFTRVGVDYFGPFLVKRARSELKRYGCLFTCLTTRAIHLEVAYTLDTNSFINALQRFIARRGQPSEIRSDNGSNFVGMHRELDKAIMEWNQDKISDHLLQNNTQ